VNCTLVAAHGGVATPCNSGLLRVVAPCPAPPQTHTSPCPTDLFRLITAEKPVALLFFNYFVNFDTSELRFKLSRIHCCNVTRFMDWYYSPLQRDICHSEL
jgi:hypothetical protein